ncbi:hypothetical protein TNCV_4313161 [Trichonephila clavipes]|nr:hypothetical protein TNCV_4313161 [Trichonephila clavipes]
MLNACAACGTLNIHWDTSLLERLVEGEDRLEAPDHPPSIVVNDADCCAVGHGLESLRRHGYHFAKVATTNDVEVDDPAPSSYVIKILQNKLIEDWESWLSNLILVSESNPSFPNPV